jgi:hypothetical protein
MNIISKNWHKLIIFVYALVFPVVSFAGDTDFTPCSLSGKICNPIPDIHSIPDFIQTFLTKALELGIPVIALAIIYCGFLFVSARGNSEKLTKAKDALLYTLIGAAVLLGAWAIATLIKNTVTGLA